MSHWSVVFHGHSYQLYKQLNNNIPSINIHPFTKNLNVLDVDNMDTIREDVV
jgi:hypothetical protein